jgi:hypothetical protein
MTNRPTLSDSATRKLAVLQDDLRDKEKLTDADLSGCDHERQRLMRIVAKPAPGQNLSRAREKARWLGVGPSTRVALGLFRAIDSEYWTCWNRADEPYEVYAGWLETLKQETVAVLQSIWQGRSASSDKWFAQACKPEIEKALSEHVRGRIAQARQVEMIRLGRKQREVEWCEAWTRRGTGTNPKAVTYQKPDTPAASNAVSAVNAGDPEAERRVAVNAYIEEVFSRTGKRITRKDIWKSAGYDSRTEFERWERNDPKRPNKAANERFTKILAKKPHLN